ncbi:hypothetical protein SAMN04515671_1086 [Nakamurella panacisegetis]|uniref:Uncharacterized protein n=1 Tax=Nakamurella panacisegetis TaxID=1090615 RepID=A0A1H0JXX4_9ACTN|nr:hypothetical protein [Nakamurella panacisegetis]SDO48399.1 hypothetical protein SAMN04515671_1086 [Nakamurella panacisegetis]
MAWGDVAAWAAAVVAAGGAAVAWKQAANSNRSARASVVAADRAAAAAERSAAADERAVALAEEQASNYVPVWRFEHESGEIWSLVNGSNETAFGAELFASSDLVNRIDRTPQDVQPGSALQFFAMRTNATVDDKITVTWYRRESRTDVQQSWTRPLPRK